MRLTLATLLLVECVAAAGCGGAGISATDAERWVSEHADVVAPVRCHQIRDFREYWCETPKDRRVSRMLVRASPDTFTIIQTCLREGRGFGDRFDPGYDSCDYAGGLNEGGFDPG